MRTFSWRPLFLAMLCCSCAGCRQRSAPAPGPSQLPQQLRPSAVRHLGHPVAASLAWEKLPRFQAAQRSCQAKTRLAAFETVLPDPLPGEEANVALAARLLAGKIVPVWGVFSMNEAVGPYSAERGFGEGPVYVGGRLGKTIGGGVCKIATTLYNTAILADLTILERHAHGMPVPYVAPGQDATVTYGVHDFRFQNNTGNPLLVWAGTKGNTLWIAFYGRQQKVRQVAWHHRTLSRRPTWTIREADGSLSPGREKVKEKGADGLTVRSWLTVTYAGGRKTVKDLGVDHYEPLPRVVAYGAS